MDKNIKLEYRINRLKTNFVPLVNAPVRKKMDASDRELEYIISNLFNYNEPNVMMETIYQLPDHDALGYSCYETERDKAKLILEGKALVEDGWYVYAINKKVYIIHNAIFDTYGIYNPATYLTRIYLNGNLVRKHDVKNPIIRKKHVDEAEAEVLYRKLTEYPTMPKIFERINEGLKDDWVDPGTKQVWMVKKYLSGETPNYVEVWDPSKSKLIGRAFINPREAELYNKTINMKKKGN